MKDNLPNTLHQPDQMRLPTPDEIREATFNRLVVLGYNRVELEAKQNAHRPWWKISEDTYWADDIDRAAGCGPRKWETASQFLTRQIQPFRGQWGWYRQFLETTPHLDLLNKTNVQDNLKANRLEEITLQPNPERSGWNAREGLRQSYDDEYGITDGTDGIIISPKLIAKAQAALHQLASGHPELTYKLFDTLKHHLLYALNNAHQELQANPIHGQEYVPITYDEYRDKNPFWQNMDDFDQLERGDPQDQAVLDAGNQYYDREQLKDAAATNVRHIIGWIRAYKAIDQLQQGLYPSSPSLLA